MTREFSSTNDKLKRWKKQTNTKRPLQLRPKGEELLKISRWRGWHRVEHVCKINNICDSIIKIWSSIELLWISISDIAELNPKVENIPFNIQYSWFIRETSHHFTMSGGAPISSLFPISTWWTTLKLHQSGEKRGWVWCFWFLYLLY